MKYTAILVDDEAHAIRTLTAQLEWSKLSIKVIGSASTVSEAEKLLLDVKPDFLFLDVKMPGETSFELFNIIDETVTETIFVTAHDEYALQAYQHHASGYLMKPVITKELKALLEKLMQRRGKLAESNQDLVIRTKSGILKLPIKDILYIAAESGLTLVHFEDGSERTVPKLLKELEELLSSKGFVRCHHKYLVNIMHVAELKKARNSKLTLSNGLSLPVSRAKKPAIYAHFDEYR